MNSAKAIGQDFHLTELIGNDAKKASEVRNRRRCADQDVAFGARPFILCGLPIRPLSVSTPMNPSG